MKILITGGAGFVGSALARSLRQRSGVDQIVAFDNLRRRGSEANVHSLLAAGVSFVHGDVRNRDDLDSLPGVFDLIVEASAEPSVNAGIEGSPNYLFDTNLYGAINCLEFARRRGGGVIFLSTSRVYSIRPLRDLPLVERESRLDLPENLPPSLGLSYAGVSEDFSTASARSYYGASKLSAEFICHEYAETAKVPVVINRCGVIAGPGQFGKVDQGVFTLWVARHILGRTLTYTGFGGEGLQVRDLLHCDDLCDLISTEIASWSTVAGQTFNVGGGRTGSVSLKEFTSLCQKVTGESVTIGKNTETNTVDIPWYITDHSRITSMLGWTPLRRPLQIVQDIADWVVRHKAQLSNVIG